MQAALLAADCKVTHLGLSLGQGFGLGFCLALRLQQTGGSSSLVQPVYTT